MRLGPSADDRAELISFEDTAPEGEAPAWMWHGLGKDAAGRIYVFVGDAEERFGRPGDVNLFRFDPSDGNRTHLGSIRRALAELGNLGPTPVWPHEEGVAKVHCDLIEHKGLLYFSTHDLHTGDRPEETRGGHLMSFDPASGHFSDLTAGLDLGVAVPNEGIIALNIIREEGILVGLTYPRGRIVLLGLATGETTVYDTDRETDPVEVARTVVVTAGGDIFGASKGPDGESRLYVVDRQAGLMRSVRAAFGRGFFEGLAPGVDTTLLADTDGEIYRLEHATRRLVPLGPIMPNRVWWRAQRVIWLRSLATSPDGEKVFALARLWFFGSKRHHLFEYELATGRRTHLGSLGQFYQHAMPSGNAPWDDRGRFYLSCYFGTDRRPLSLPGRHPGLMRIDVSDRIGVR